MSNLPTESAPDWSDEELLLLRSAKHDRPSVGSLATTLAAVGVGTAVASTVSTAATAHAALATAGKGAGTTAVGWVGAAGAAKWLSIVTIAGAITVSGIALEQHASKTERARPPVHAERARDHAASAHTQAVREQTAAATAAPEPATVAPPPATAVAAPQPARAKSLTRNEPPPTALSPSQPDLRREIASIDAARVALRRGAAGEALEALDRYDADYENTGSLKLEASALRIEALFSHGDRARASALARTFLARHPKSPYAAAIRKLLAADQAAR